MAKVTKEHAEAIASKLSGTIHPKKNRPHDLCIVVHEGQVVARFGIRRGSGRNLGHGHIPGDLHLGPHDTVLLAQCSITREGWIKMLQDKGIIQKPSAEEAKQSDA